MPGACLVGVGVEVMPVLLFAMHIPIDPHCHALPAVEADSGG